MSASVRGRAAAAPLYYVIYTSESYGDEPVVWPPERARRALQQTEESVEDVLDASPYLRAHVKFAGELTRDELDELCDATGLELSTVGAMGSLTEHGLLPADLYVAPDYGREVQTEAYVTPLRESLAGAGSL